MKLNKLLILSSVLLAVSCQSTASSQRSVSISGLVPMSGTASETISNTESDVDRSGVAVRLENRDGAIGLGVEIRQATYNDPSNAAPDSDGIELAGFFRRYLEDSNNSAFLEASPILGLGLENDLGIETSSYALLRLAAGYRWSLAEDIFIDVDAGYYLTLMSTDIDVVGSETSIEVDGIDVTLAIGMHF
ncbi:MAG: hypothetical protein ACI84O_000537 [Myxococcota bacterium]|jgi:hypothetical protein